MIKQCLASCSPYSNSRVGLLNVLREETAGCLAEVRRQSID